jgi:hypothetical protein
LNYSKGFLGEPRLLVASRRHVWPAPRSPAGGWAGDGTEDVKGSARGGGSEISCRGSRGRGRIQRGRHRKRAGLGKKPAGSDPMENVMRLNSAMPWMGISDMPRGVRFGLKNRKDIGKDGVGFSQSTAIFS